MSGEINVTNPDGPKKVLIVIANPATSTTLGIPVGYWGEDAAKKRSANYIPAGRFKSFAVRDGRRITGQQQYSGAEVARLVIEALGT
jgi:putative intracellular protease/amidase